MADLKRYQVLSACVIVPVDGPDGTVARTLYRGQVFDGDPGNERVKHNADSGYIAEIGADAVAGTDAEGTPLVDDKPTAERAAAEPPAKAAPKKAAGEKAASEKAGRGEDLAALRERAVKAGMDRAEVDKASEADLRAALKE